METYDVAVIGLGGMGSAAAWHLARTGARVIGLERHGPAHALGSSHGLARVIRQAYHEDPAYVPLLKRAYELWDDLARRSANDIWKIIGGVSVGLPSAPSVAGALGAAHRYDLDLETMTPDEARQRYPAVRPRRDEIVVYEATVGALFPEQCVMAHLNAAVGAGATLRFGAPVRSWNASSSVTIELESGERIEAGQMVLASGPWTNGLTDGRWPIRLERNTQHWFAAAAPAGPDRLPIFMIERSDVGRLFYGFPDLGDGLKIALHKSGAVFHDPNAVVREISREDIDRAELAIRSWIPDVVGRHLRSTACIYSTTPDENFIIGRHPESMLVVVAGGFSGHGFKFCSVVGEVVADLVVRGSTPHPIGLFDPLRFAV